MSRLVHVALVQFNSIVNQPKENAIRAAAFVKQAALNGAQIVCFPELFSTGYHLDLVGPQLSEVAEIIDGETIRILQQSAKENHCYVIAPVALEKDIPGIYYNSAVLISDEGVVAGIYDKHHACFDEGRYYREGAEIPVFDTRYGRIGIMICYDMGFPEIARVLMLKGAEIIFVPSAWCEQDQDMWDIQVPARGLENLIFVAAVNRCGSEKDTHFFGGSKIVNWRGKIIAACEGDEETILHATLDLDELHEARSQIKYLVDRKPESYRIISEI